MSLTGTPHGEGTAGPALEMLKSYRPWRVGSGSRSSPALPPPHNPALGQHTQRCARVCWLQWDRSEMGLGDGGAETVVGEGPVDGITFGPELRGQPRGIGTLILPTSNRK